MTARLKLARTYLRLFNHYLNSVRDLRVDRELDSALSQSSHKNDSSFLGLQYDSTNFMA